ncbi:MAG: tetratricopeptide repeat protein [Acidobacteriota bacterium]|nr:tetratricopeptide repeat protein [Acidobacteriota bacterium]
MRLRSSIISGLLLLLFYQSPQDTIRQHYQAAEAARLAGNLDAAELEYAAILGEGYERLGRVYTARAEHKEALNSLESAQKYRPNSAEVLVDLAIAYFGAQQYEKALAAASGALAIAPNNPGAHQMLGKTYFMLGDLGKAITELEAATKISPNDIDVSYTLGIAYLRNRQPVAAKQLYDSLIKLYGDEPQLHVVIGRAYRQSGLLADAAEEFKKAIALDDRAPRAHYYLGMTYLLDEGQNKISEALAEFKIEADANPGEFLANYYLGVVYNFQRQWESALPFLQKALSLQPSNPDPYFQLGQAFQELNRHEQAIEVLKKAIALNPDLEHNQNQVTTAHHRLAQSLLKIGQTDAGRKELQIASDLKAKAFKLEQQTPNGMPDLGSTKSSAAANELLEISSVDHSSAGPNNLDEKSKGELQSSEAFFKKIIGTAHNNVGLLRAERHDFSGAAEQFALAAKWDPGQEGVDYNMGLAYYKSESYKEAAAPLENELKLHPGSRAATILLGLTWFRLGNYAGVSELLTDMDDTQPADVNLHYALASSLIKLGKADAADRAIERMKANTGDGPQIHLLLAEKYYSKGSSAKALAELNEVATANTPLVHYYAALLYLNLKKHDEAIREFEKELLVNPNDSQTRYSLAGVLLTGKDVDRGLSLIREVIQIRPNHAEARYTLGKVLLQKGDLAGAIDNLERASQLAPEKSDAHYQLGQAYLAAGRKSEGKSQIDISKQLRNRHPAGGNEK